MKEPMTQLRLTTTDRAFVRVGVAFFGRMQELGLSMPREFGYGRGDPGTGSVATPCACIVSNQSTSSAWPFPVSA